MYEKRDNETFFEWKLRLCKGKINGGFTGSWEDIVDILGLDVSADHLRKTAYGLIEYDNYIHNDTAIGTRILALSDFHIPFNLPITTFEDYAGLVDILVLNGDLVDMQGISKFPKTYRLSPMEEIIKCREYLIKLIDFIKPKKVYITYGNHEKRFATYLSKSLDCDLMGLMPETPLELIVDSGFIHYDKLNGIKKEYAPISDFFDETSILFVDDWKVKVGKTWFCHPIAYSSGNLKTCEKAMNYFHKTDTERFDTVVLGHTHKVGYYKMGNVHLYEQGCCCDTKALNYADGKLTAPQKQGFLYICQDKYGNLIEEKTKLHTLN